MPPKQVVLSKNSVSPKMRWKMHTQKWEMHLQNTNAWIDMPSTACIWKSRRQNICIIIPAMCRCCMPSILVLHKMSFVLGTYFERERKLLGWTVTTTTTTTTSTLWCDGTIFSFVELLCELDHNPKRQRLGFCVICFSFSHYKTFPSSSPATASWYCYIRIEGLDGRTAWCGVRDET